MRHRRKIILIVLGSVLGVMVVAIVAGLVVIQTPWFRGMVRDRIAGEIEKATGGRTEIGALSFSLSSLTAHADSVVIHGAEGPNEPPLFRAASIAVGLKILSAPKHAIDIDSLTVRAPVVYLRVSPDGTTNLPHPPTPPSGEDPIQTVLDMAIGRLRISDGSIQLADRKIPLDLQGENVRAQMAYNALNPSYTGNISIAPLDVRQNGRPPLPVNVNLPFKLVGKGIEIQTATLSTPASTLQIAGSVQDLAAPQGSVRLNGRLSPQELAPFLSSSKSVDLRRAPPVELKADAGLNHNQLRLAGLQIVMGTSIFDAHGTLTDLRRVEGALQFDGKLDLAQLGRVLGVSSRPSGVVQLNGDAKLAGTENYSVQAKLAASGVAVQAGARRLTGIAATSQITVLPKEIELKKLHLAALGGTLDASGAIRNLDRFQVDGALHHFDLRHLGAVYGSRNIAWAGIVSGPAHVRGSLKGQISRTLLADTQVVITPGNQGIPVSGRIDIAYDGPRDAIDLGDSFVALPHSRLDLAGSISQPANGPRRSALVVQLVSRDLNDFLPAVALASSNPPASLPVTLSKGEARFNGAVDGQLSDPRIRGRVQITNFVVNQQKFDRFAAEVALARNGAAIQNAVLVEGKAQAQLSASVGLADWKPEPSEPVAANVSVQGARIRDLVAAAGLQDMPVDGNLEASARVSGTIGNPNGTADVRVANAVAYDQPIHQLQANAGYSGQRIQGTFSATAPFGRVDFKGTYDHQPNNLSAGRVEFHLATSPLKLASVKPLQERKPGLAGTLEAHADGAGTLASTPGRPSFVLSELNSNLAARSVALNGKQLGDLNATAHTAGRNVTFQLQSNVAGSDIRGQGTWTLDNDYPVDARLSFSQVRIGPLIGLVSASNQPQETALDGVLEGTLAVSGPALRTDELKGALRLTKLQLNAQPPAASASQPREKLELHNDGPIAVNLDHSIVRVESARLTGNDTNFAVTGAVGLNKQDALDLHANGTIGLKLAQAFSPDVFAAGDLRLNAEVRGAFSQPVVNGQIQLDKASFNLTSSPIGISDANGVIQFNGSRAVIRNLTATSGGGKISLGGTVGYGGNETEFRLQAKADHVHIPSDTVTAQVNAGLSFTGTTTSSSLSGKVTVLDVAVHSHTDFGSMLSGSATPPSTPSGTTADTMLNGLRLNIAVDTSPDVQFRSALLQNLQAGAHLRVRGTAANPGMLGRVNATEGEVVFFGSKYTINRGTVSFFNPVKIDPILDLALETKAQGIDVTLNVTGPMDKLQLAYHSDPPLQFTDIVQLLATGKVTTTDPVLVAQQPPAPQQSLAQQGASTVLNQAAAAPIAGRMQRLFGVTALKINPQITGAQNTPSATLALEQQISPDLDFTYIEDLTSSNPQVIRIEWTIDPTWSAILLRQGNGDLGVDFYYKKRFK